MDRPEQERRIAELQSELLESLKDRNKESKAEVELHRRVSR
jgi:hypothetical protein